MVEWQQRLGDLRCAARVFSPTLGVEAREALLRTAKLLDERLLALAEPRRWGTACRREPVEGPHGAPDGRSDLARLDGDFRASAEILGAGLGRATLPLRRSLLEQLERASRAAASTLLDLLIEDEGRLADRLAIIVDLVTLLATEGNGGRPRVVRDPSALTAKLRSLAERSGVAARIDLEQAEQTFIEIAQRGANDGVEVVAEELDACKAELGVAMLAPPVLRAIAFCDAMTWRSALEEAGDRRVSPPEASPFPSAALERAAKRQRGDQTASRSDASARQDVALAERAASDSTGFRWATSPPTISETGPARRPKPSASRPAMRRRMVAGLVGVVASVGLATYLWSGPQRQNVRTFSNQELAALSPEIASGYRSGSGAGPLFVGTVRRSWSERSHAERGEMARRMIDRLASSGVREVLLLDEARRVALHHAEGIPLQIGPEAAAG